MNHQTEPLVPIPIPARLRWQAFCRELLPVLAFGIGVIVVVQLWDRAATVPSFIAEAEVLRAEVRSIQPGVLSEYQVSVMQPVEAGELLGYVMTTDPKVLESRLAVMQAELQMLTLTMSPALQQQRVAVDYERLQLDHMRQRVELAAMRANLSQAEITLSRMESLRRAQGVAEQMYDEAVIRRDRYLEQVQEQERLLTQMAPALRQLDPTAPGQGASPQEALQAAMAVQAERLKLLEAEMSPVPLRAPIRGVVSRVLRRPGEVVTRGEPLIEITSPQAQHLVGFLRQPLGPAPAAGTEVDVVTRARPRRATKARVEQVGAALEPILPSLHSALRLADAGEMGLRVQLIMPDEFTLRPGEHVDVRLRRR